MRSSVWDADGQYVGSVEGRDFLDRRGTKIGEVRNGSIYRTDGVFVCGIQPAGMASQRDTISAPEFAGLMETRQAE